MTSPQPTPQTYFSQLNVGSQCTSASPTTSKTPPSKPLPSKTVRLYISARDLPEPDARSRASYAVIYYAKETPAVPSPIPRRPDPPSPSPLSQPLPSPNSIADTVDLPHLNKNEPQISILSDASAASADSDRNLRPRSSTASIGTQQSLVPRRLSSNPTTTKPTTLLPDADLLRSASQGLKKPSLLRAPHIAPKYAAPDEPTNYIAGDGTEMQLSAWMKIATTDVARKHGRDVEFARSLRIPYIPSERQIIRVVFFDCPSRDVEKQRLIGTAEFPLVSVCSAKGLPVNFPLRFLAVTKRDVKRSSRIPDGTAVICADVVTDRESKFRLDVECNKIIKAKALKSAPVKRLFYTIHAIIDKEKKSDRWTLIYRSDSVEMINKKRDGGSLEYNYFSSRRLVAGHGVVIEDPDEASDKSPGKGVRSSGGLLERVGKTLGMRQNERFFSLPGADLTLQRVDTRLKLSLFEDNGSLGGFDLIADTAFTIADLKSRELGGSSAIKVHSNVMGKAVLKYVECSKDPRYFCLSLVMHNLR